MEWVEAGTLKRFSPEKAQKIGLFRAERAMADLYCLLPGQAQKPHIHETSDKIYYVIEGTARFRIGLQDGSYRLAPRCWPLPRRSTGLRIQGRALWSYLWFSRRHFPRTKAINTSAFPEAGG